jgi:BED zinc finger
MFTDFNHFTIFLKNKKLNEKINKNESPVWKYFKKLLGTGSVTCNLCSKNIKRASNTTNMWRHLESDHVEVYKRNKMP